MGVWYSRVVLSIYLLDGIAREYRALIIFFFFFCRVECPVCVRVRVFVVCIVRCIHHVCDGAYIQSRAY